MTTELADERLVFELLVDVADEGATSHVAARNLVDWANLLLTCEGVADNNIASHPSACEYLLGHRITEVVDFQRSPFFLSPNPLILTLK